MKLNYIYRLSLGIILPAILLLPISTGSAQTVTPVVAPATVPEKDIALTFDDGPYGAPTIEVLNILEKENIHATFFMIGQNVEKYPDIVKEIVEDGNTIGNHSYNHPTNLATMPLKELDSEVSKAEEAIFTVTNLHPAFFRAPYGNTSPKMLKELAEDKYTLVGWNVDPTDWDYPKSTSELIEKRIQEQVKPNSIILLHDGRDTHINYPRDNMINALPNIIESLKKEGYTFVTIDKLLNKSPYN